MTFCFIFLYHYLYCESFCFFVYSHAVVCYEFAFAAAAAVVVVDGNGWCGVFHSLRQKQKDNHHHGFHFECFCTAVCTDKVLRFQKSFVCSSFLGALLLCYRSDYYLAALETINRIV